MSFASSLSLFFLAWFFQRIFGSWLSPSAFFAGYWAVCLSGALIVAPEFGFWVPAGWVILCFCTVFGFGEALVCMVLNQKNGKYSKISTDVYWILQWGMPMLVILTLASFASCVILIMGSSYASEVFSHPGKLLEIGLENANKRYLYQETNRLVIFVNMFMYLGAFTGGAWAAMKKTWWGFFFGGAVLLPGLLQSLLVNARTGMMWLFIFFLASYLAVAVFKNEHRIFFTLKKGFFSISIVVFFIALFFSLQLIREGENAFESDVSLIKTKVSVCCPPYLFSKWLRQNWHSVEASYGLKTFNGFFSLLGFPDPQALGWEGIEIETAEGDFSPNVYTAFRQLIEDFTLLGSFFFLFALGVATGIAYRRVLMGKYFWFPILALFYAVTLGSYLSNWLNYTSLLLAWVMFFCVNCFFSFLPYCVTHAEVEPRVGKDHSVLCTNCSCGGD